MTFSSLNVIFKLSKTILYEQAVIWHDQMSGRHHGEIFSTVDLVLINQSIFNFIFKLIFSSDFLSVSQFSSFCAIAHGILIFFGFLFKVSSSKIIENRPALVDTLLQSYLGCGPQSNYSYSTYEVSKCS